MRADFEIQIADDRRVPAVEGLLDIGEGNRGHGDLISPIQPTEVVRDKISPRLALPEFKRLNSAVCE
ncbi:hypothetical protein [Caballeronia novacaledonica]|uniref:hypothetical protein n=1 Tax=Caballeronia novacaledonica TaxID=1544861 RepID=UPI0011B1E6C9|nr:hypothetical protein [Caballeronia novacaledonica]